MLECRFRPLAEWPGTPKKSYEQKSGNFKANPVRLRRLRRKGFDLQAASRAINGRECVIVDRTNRRWGNPFVVGKHGTPDECLHGYREYLEAAQAANPEEFANELAKLRGKNLACWCAPEQQCHVDVLLEWANKEERMELR